MHPRNKHQGQYDFQELIATYPDLAQFVQTNKYGKKTVDFFNPTAVKALNSALLKSYYQLDYWDIPAGYLCPPIPGRANYIHLIADLLSGEKGDIQKFKIPKGPKIKCLDIGVGANCIYPIIGNKEYGWSFVGADIDKRGVSSANKIIEADASLKRDIEIRWQTNTAHIFKGIIQKREVFDLSICNPPFHASAEEAEAATARKLKNLKGKKEDIVLNFGGQHTELWCEGGEGKFVRNMILESKQFSTSCFWFTSLISKETNLKKAYTLLKKIKAVQVKTIAMKLGNKTSRILAWTFLSPKQQQIWKKSRWV